MDGYAQPDGAGPSGQNELEEIIVPPGPTNQPRVFVRSIRDDQAVFNLSGVELAYANSIRRVIMADVPTISACAILLWMSPLEWLWSKESTNNSY